MVDGQKGFLNSRRAINASVRGNRVYTHAIVNGVSKTFYIRPLLMACAALVRYNRVLRRNEGEIQRVGLGERRHSLHDTVVVVASTYAINNSKSNCCERDNYGRAGSGVKSIAATRCTDHDVLTMFTGLRFPELLAFRTYRKTRNSLDIVASKRDVFVLIKPPTVVSG